MGSPNVEYQVQTFKKLRELQMKGLLCDLVLISVDNVQFRVHASVVVAASQSFYNLLMEKGSLKKIRLMNVTGNALDLLVRFIYGEVLNNFDDLKLLSQTLMKLGMKDLFQFIGTSLCDYITLGSPTSGCHVSSSRKKTTAFSNEKENPTDGTTHSDGSKKSGRDSKKTKSLPSEVKVEPFSEKSKNNKCENDTCEDFSSVKVKSEPPETFNYIYGEAPVNELNQRAVGEKDKRSTTDKSAVPVPGNTALKPVGLYLNETLTQNKTLNSKHPSSSSLLDIENLAEKYGIKKPPSETGCSNQACDHTNHSYKAVIDGLNDFLDSKITKELEKSGHNVDISPKQHKQVVSTQKPLSEEELVSHINIISKRVPVLLRPIDDSGNYALFPANLSMAAFGDSPVQASQLQQYAEIPQNTQHSEAVKLDTSAPQETIDNKQMKSDKVQAKMTSPGKTADTAAQQSFVQASPNGQLPMQTGQQIVLSPNGQLISVVPQNNVTDHADTESNLVKPAVPMSPGRRNTSARKQKIKQNVMQSSKVRKIVPKEELKIESVVSLQGNPESHSERVKDFLSNLGIDCPVDSVTPCSDESLEDRYDKLVDDLLKDRNVVRTRSDTAKRKMSCEKCPPPLKKMRDLHDDLDEDSQEYLVIDLGEKVDLESQDSQMSGSSDVPDPKQDESVSVGNKSHPTADKTEDRVPLKKVQKVSDLSIQEVPNFIVGRKKKAKTVSFTLRKELNFFHDQEEVPPNSQIKIPRSSFTQCLTTTQPISATTMLKASHMTQTSQVSCVGNVSQNAQSDAQNTIKPNSDNDGAVNPANNVPVMVQFPDGKIATVMIPEIVRNSSQVPSVPPQSQVVVSQGKVHTNSNANTQSQMASVQNTCTKFVQGVGAEALPGVSGITQPITTVISGTHQLVHQPLSSGDTVSNMVQGMQPVSGILQPPVINGNQVVSPQFLVRNIAGQDLTSALTIPSPNRVQLPGQQMIMQHTQSVPLPNMPNVPLNVNYPTPFSQSLQVPAVNSTRHPTIQVFAANGPLMPRVPVPVGHQVPSQLIMSPSGGHTPTSVNQLPTIRPKTEAKIAAEKNPVPKKMTHNLKELRPKQTKMLVLN